MNGRDNDLRNLDLRARKVTKEFIARQLKAA